jgi:hypothetical protein
MERHINNEDDITYQAELILDILNVYFAVKCQGLIRTITYSHSPAGRQAVRKLCAH